MPHVFYISTRGPLFFLGFAVDPDRGETPPSRQMTRCDNGLGYSLCLRVDLELEDLMNPQSSMH
jgi:hypothetical protein